jgi:hypothetical protein
MSPKTLSEEILRAERGPHRVHGYPVTAPKLLKSRTSDLAKRISAVSDIHVFLTSSPTTTTA